MDLGGGHLMAKATHVTLDWADGSYTFRLPIGQLEEHDELCGAGPLAVLTRLGNGTWHVPDIRETVRLGLIGGGTPAVEALKLTRRYVDGAPLIQSVPVAMVVLAAALRGEDVEAKPVVGKDAAAEPVTQPDPTGSTSPRTDEQASPSASPSVPSPI